MVSQIKQEVAGALDFIQTVYGFLGMTFTLKLSTKPESALGDPEVWETAERYMMEALNEFQEKTGHSWSLNPGDGAFYGPKIDVQVYDALKEERTRIQSDPSYYRYDDDYDDDYDDQHATTHVDRLGGCGTLVGFDVSPSFFLIHMSSCARARHQRTSAGSNGSGRCALPRIPRAGHLQRKSLGGAGKGHGGGGGGRGNATASARRRILAAPPAEYGGIFGGEASGRRQWQRLAAPEHPPDRGLARLQHAPL